MADNEDHASIQARLDQKHELNQRYIISQSQEDINHKHLTKYPHKQHHDDIKEHKDDFDFCSHQLNNSKLDIQHNIHDDHKDDYNTKSQQKSSNENK